MNGSSSKRPCFHFPLWRALSRAYVSADARCVVGDVEVWCKRVTGCVLARCAHRFWRRFHAAPAWLERSGRWVGVKGRLALPVEG